MSCSNLRLKRADAASSVSPEHMASLIKRACSQHSTCIYNGGDFFSVTKLKSVHVLKSGGKSWTEGVIQCTSKIRDMFIRDSRL